jgi:hypothetical protein
MGIDNRKSKKKIKEDLEKIVKSEPGDTPKVTPKSEE